MKLNIFNEIERVNISNGKRFALGVRKANGDTLRYTYSEMFEKIEECYKNLNKLGIKAGNRVAIIAPTSPEWVINYLALQKMNATAVLLDASLEKNDLMGLIEKSDLRAVIASDKIFEKLDILRKMPCIDIERFGKLFKGSQTKIRKVSVEENSNVSSIIYSSGTTKTASGIMHAHDSLIKTTYMTIECNNLQKNTVFIGMLPDSHIYGVITQILGPMLLGSCIYSLESLDAENLVGALKEYKPNIIPSVPKVYELLYTQILKKIESKKITKVMFEKLFPVCLKLRNKTKINLGKYIFSSVQKGFGGNVDVLCSAGAPLSKEIAEFFYGTGFKMLITYGATETNIPTIGNYGKNITMDSCGKKYPDVDIKIDDNGELLIKSPYMMLGYFNDEEATKEAFNEEGWFKSGDLARINEMGNVEILGRCKENIVLATGKKVAPDDIEKNYQNIPFVQDIAICGIPAGDGSYDEVYAFVVASEEKHEEIKEYIQKISSESSQNMKIMGIHFVDEIPRTSLKKPKRFLLKKCVTQINEKEKCEIVKPVTVKENVYTVLSNVAKVNISDLNDDVKILTDLTIDSLGIIELELELEKMYGVNLEKKINKDTNISDLINILETPEIIDDDKSTKGKIKRYLAKYPLKRRAWDYKIFKFYANLVKKVYKVSINNEEVLPDDSAYIVCPNHVSNFDYLYLSANFCKERFKKFYCVAKQELFTNKAMSKLIARVSGMIPLERNGIATETIKKVKEKIKDKCGIVIFPEGTRSKDGKLGDCKKGAAMISVETKTPIIPAYIQGAFEIYPSGRKLPKLFNWKKKEKYEVNVFYGKPIDSEGKSIEELTAEVRDAILELAQKYGAKKEVMKVG